jgi:hypothetical protein
MGLPARAIPSASPADVIGTPALAAGVAASANELEAVMQRVEQHLDDLQAALGARDMRCIELHAGELQRALAKAIDRFRDGARRGGTPPELRRRLALAGAQVAAQRDALARATAALDRAIDVLMPSSSGAAVYAPSGLHGTRRSPTSLEA